MSGSEVHEDYGRVITLSWRRRSATILAMELTHKERYLRLFNGEPVDRAPFYLIMGPSRQALDRWSNEGLEVELDVHDPMSYRRASAKVRDMFGFDTNRGYMLEIRAFVWPEFPEEVIDENNDYVHLRTKWGSVKRLPKEGGRMALQETPLVTDWESWEKIKVRLKADTPGRLPDNWSEVCAEARVTDFPVYTGDLPIGFFGGPRELVGTEGLCTMFYDNPSLISDILDTLCDLWIDLYSKAYHDAPFDYFFVWEDMCYKNGPLISPATFREFLLPRYKRLTSALKKLGVKLIMVDSDGDTRKLVPLWIEGGVDITFPWETQYGLDITTVRKQFPDVGIIGGVNKSALAFGKAAIDKELNKVAWMLEQGRYLPGLDHETPPEVPWNAFKYYCEELRELVWKHTPKPTR